MSFTLHPPSLGASAQVGGGFVHVRRWGSVTVQDLEDAVTASTLVQLTDDDRDGVADTRVVASVIEDAEAEAQSFLPGYYSLSAIPGTDRLVRLAIRDFAISFLFRRHPEYVKTFGQGSRSDALYNRAVERCQRIQQGTQQLPDVKQRPKNSGSFLDVSGPRTIIDGFDGENNNPLF